MGSPHQYILINDVRVREIIDLLNQKLGQKTEFHYYQDPQGREIVSIDERHLKLLASQVDETGGKNPQARILSRADLDHFLYASQINPFDQQIRTALESNPPTFLNFRFKNYGDSNQFLALLASNSRIIDGHNGLWNSPEKLFAEANLMNINREDSMHHQYDFLIDHLKKLTWLIENTDYGQVGGSDIFFHSPIQVTRNNGKVSIEIPSLPYTEDELKYNSKIDQYAAISGKGFLAEDSYHLLLLLEETRKEADLELNRKGKTSEDLGGVDYLKLLIVKAQVVKQREDAEWSRKRQAQQKVEEAQRVAVEKVQKTENTIRKFFDGPFTDFLHSLYTKASYDQDGVNRLLEGADRAGGKTFEGDVKSFFESILRQEDSSVVYRKARKLNDQYFIPEGFLAHLYPSDISGGGLIAYYYEKGEIQKKSYVRNPFNRESEITVFYVKSGVSAFERKMGRGDQVTFHLGQTDSDPSIYDHKGPSGMGSPIIDLVQVEKRANSINARYLDQGYPYQGLLKKQYGDALPSREVLKEQIAESTRLHELRHAFDMQVSPGIGELDSEISASLVEIAKGPAPFADLELLFYLTVQARGAALSNSSADILTRFARYLKVIGPRDFLIEVIEDKAGARIGEKAKRKAVWKIASRDRLLKKLCELSEDELRSLASRVYKDIFTMPLSPIRNAYQVVRSERVNLKIR